MHHAAARALERYGADLSPADLTAIERQIAAGASVMARRYDHGSEWHMVRHGERVLLAVIKRRPGRVIVVTFLPPDALSAGAHYANRKRRPLTA